MFWVVWLCGVFFFGVVCIGYVVVIIVVDVDVCLFGMVFEVFEVVEL